MPSSKTDDLSSTDHEAIAKEMLEGSDFSCALLGASAIDITLRHVILRHLKRTDKTLVENLFDRPGAPFSSLSHKILYAEASGLLSHGDAARLHQVRRVRNEFAHRAERLTFDSPDISGLTGKLGEPATYSSRIRYVRATIKGITGLMNVSLRQFGREIAEVNAKHKRTIASIKRRHARAEEEIRLLYGLEARQIEGPPLSNAERAKLRRLRVRLAKYITPLRTGLIKGN